MEELIKQYYPEPAFYSYIYLRAVCGIYDGIRIGESTDKVDPQHLKDLEMSGFLKTDGKKITLREDGRWLCDPPEVVKRERKGPYEDPRLDTLVEIVGYPIDWHKRGKYESLFRALTKKYDWTIIQDIAHFWKDNKPEPDLVLNYFLTEKCFKQIQYQQANPKKKIKLFRVDVDLSHILGEEGECPF